MIAAWDRRWVWAAVAMGLGMLAICIFVRPLWRDEYWALYFSQPDLPLSTLVWEMIPKHEHPPGYYSLLYFWRSIIDTDLWVRLFNVLIYAAAGWGIWRLGRDRPRETGAFLLLAATSYWFIYFGTEARMYALMFAGSAVTCFIARRALEGRVALTALLFAAIGAIVALGQVFSAMWIGVIGGWTTLAFAWRRDWRAFFIWSLATAVAVGPAIGWVLHTRPDQIYDASLQGNAFWHEAGEATNQFVRGLVVKTFGSNLVAFIAAFLCVGALWRRKDMFDVVLALSVLACVVIPFAFHLIIQPMIKERGFIVIMPAVILLAVRAIELVRDDQKIARRMIGWIPIVALISPLLFIPEYFKDRERLGEVRELVEANGAGCRGAPVAIFYRPAIQGADWPEYVAKRSLRGAANGGDLNLIDLRTLNAPPPAQEGCRIRALAILLPRGETELQAEVRTELAARGFDLAHLEERQLGEKRTLIFLEPAAP